MELKFTSIGFLPINAECLVTIARTTCTPLVFVTEVAVAPVVLSVPTTSGNTWLTTDHTISNVAVLFGSDNASGVNARDATSCGNSQRQTDNDRPSTTFASLCLICIPPRWKSASEISDNKPARSAQSTATKTTRLV